ncbi:PQQ-dependent sugar dehydrogenase [Nitrosopumilus sp.]|uniref:PQQ-dependent sugar dehydrogenase n=1 Tax=Nitrosopumilus sp. TaxID=2024843 RepID=UPI00247C05B7|nr:PQQ-dependent sugar dehydrogenase [Nitrosopumilus sp.]MCV0430027.1 PQQ-dependent sugar dehydrogenase [Nitrosopumilus sp.]
MKEFIIIVILLSLIPVSFAQEYPEEGIKIEVVADNLTIPWSIDWLPDGTILFTERNGHLRIIQHGILLDDPLLSLNVGGVEGGMLGIAVDPEFSENNYIYVYYTTNEFLTTSNKLVRYQFTDGILIEDKVLIDKIPGGPFHDGGRIQFGPDGKLYVTTGEAGLPDLSQDLKSLGGKILRINSDGTIPKDNPWKNSPIYSIGHRNPQGIDWDKSGNLFATEHGPSGWRGVAHDEVNHIIAGKNYGWPTIIGDEKKDNMKTPILHSGDETWAPSGAEFYYGDKIPQWKGKYFVATLRGNHLHVIEFNSQNLVKSHEKLFENEFGRLRDIQTGPDGFLYILTSNQDGRGIPKTNDDKILRIIPINHTGINENIEKKPNPIDFREPRSYAGELYAITGIGLVGMVIGFIVIKKLMNKNKK